MSKPLDRVSEAGVNPLNRGICAVCGNLDCKKPNHTPPATKEEGMPSKETGWWW